jgi:peroxiredoxin Q/BCP
VEGCGYRDLAADFERKNAVILGVSFDSVDENAAFARKFSFPYRLLCDTGRELGMAYGACDRPGDGHARRISYILGPDGRIEHVFPKVDAKTHPAEVLKLLP